MKSRQTKLIYHKEINECVYSTQIISKDTDVKWPKGTVAIVGDSIMSETRDLIKTDKHSEKVRFLEVRLLKTWKIILSISWKENGIMLSFMSEPTTQQI